MGLLRSKSAAGLLPTCWRDLKAKADKATGDAVVAAVAPGAAQGAEGDFGDRQGARSGNLHWHDLPKADSRDAASARASEISPHEAGTL